MISHFPLSHAVIVLFAVGQPVAALAEDQPLKVSSGEAVRGTRQVVIGAFNVGFIFESVDQTKTTGGMIGAFGGATHAKSVLEGVTPAMMQAITDAAYADFRTQLAAGGFALVDTATLVSSAPFAKVKPMAAPYDVKVSFGKKGSGKSTYFTPSDMPGIVLLPGDLTTGGGFGDIGRNMAMGGNQAALAQHAKTSGQAVIDVVYLIDFSDTKRPGAFSLGGLTVSAGLSVVSDVSRMTILTPAGKTTTIVLKQPVAVEGDFVEQRDATKGAGLQKAGNIAGSVLALGGLGGLKFGKSKTFAFTARTGAYEAGATKAASLANARLVDQLTALK